MNALGTKLGLSKDLAFYDVYSLTDPDLLSLIPRPVYALLAIIPLTRGWEESRIREDAEKEEYAGSRPGGNCSSRLKQRAGRFFGCLNNETQSPSFGSSKQ